MKRCPHCGRENPEQTLICPACLGDLYFAGAVILGENNQEQDGQITDLLSDVFDSTVEGILITDSLGQIVMVNQAFTTITGYESGEAIGQNPRLLKSGRHNVSFYEEMWRELNEAGRWQGEIFNRRKNGEVYLQSLSISAVVNPQGEITNYVGIFTDITTRKEREERLEYLATHDALTGLPNRTLYHDRLNQALARAQRNQRLVAVMFLDLDGFKAVNDTHGHEFGDRLLRAVANRLTGCVRQSDTLARLGGDEFAGLIEELSNLQGATIVAQNFMLALSRPFRIDEEELGVTGSIGISMYPIDGGTSDVLLRKADVAMYRAKTHGKNTFQFHTPWK